MDADWLSSSSGRRVLALWTDPHPTWLWSADGARLLWRNPAARGFARALARSDEPSTNAVPIKGQIARVVRMATPGRSSPSRIQFLVSGRPVAATCTCRLISLPETGAGLLIVALDPVAGPSAQDLSDLEPTDILPKGAEVVLVDRDGNAMGGSRVGLATYATPSPGEDPTANLPMRLAAGPSGETLLVYPPRPADVDGHLTRGEVTSGTETQADETSDAPESGDGEVSDAARRSLSALFDRLANDPDLYAGLEPPEVSPPAAAAQNRGAADLAPASPDDENTVLPGSTPSQAEPVAGAVASPAQVPSDEPAPFTEPAAVEKAPPTLVEPAEPGLTDRTTSPDAEIESEDSGAPDSTPDGETMERVSRYNFEELSRILNDRIGKDDGRPRIGNAAGTAEPVVASPAVTQPEGQLVNLAAETFILNRLPLGILVFRDQQVLFANRALIEMTGHVSIEELRGAGLASIFPANASESAGGPVDRLMRREGTPVPVVARLQSISWQGRPALMLSASVAEERLAHEAAVRAFAELTAETQNQGFLEAARNGLIELASERARLLLGAGDGQLLGKTLADIVAFAEVPQLQQFLERPARFADTARPWLTLPASVPDTDITFFAQGQAGIVSGYFAFVRQRAGATVPPRPSDIEPAILTRLSRGVRRPLNTVIGFADLIRSSMAGMPGTERQVEYAGDIHSAGEEIALLIDELDDVIRLRDGRYAPRVTEIDLSALLQSCVIRVREQAGGARVLVRSAIAENLPRVTGDRASLGQAVLNLLASAIQQTPAGGAVVLSAQLAEEGAVLINVRDWGETASDPGERFVVFRDPGRNGAMPRAVPSTVGYALTKSLLAVNSYSLSVEPAATGTMFSLVIPSESVLAPVAV